MSRFTGDEFDIAFGQVYPEFKSSDESENCKKFLKFFLINTPEDVNTGISLTLDKNKDEMNKCLNTIIGNTSIDELMRFIDNDIISQPSSQTPFFLVKSKMLQNQEQSALPSAPASALPSAPASAPASAHPLEIAIAKLVKPRIAPTSARPSALPSARPSALPSARPPKSSITKNKDADADAEEKRIAKWWALHEAGDTDKAERYFGAKKRKPPHGSGVGGGSRRRRSSHRKRKSYRKSKRVRHTRRKQTRRHRHRRSRHRR